ncbi:MAG TPA: hypothetical protein VJL28_07840 [Gemmatimonadaceae bacterium]|nr:hypothetical protein [Gemmatimonadaceae bacterium]
MIARDLMTANPFAVTADASAKTTTVLMSTHGVGMLPVGAGGGRVQC